MNKTGLKIGSIFFLICTAITLVLSVGGLIFPGHALLVKVLNNPLLLAFFAMTAAFLNAKRENLELKERMK